MEMPGTADRSFVCVISQHGPFPWVSPSLEERERDGEVITWNKSFSRDP